jgi:hypothetical protein
MSSPEPPRPPAPPTQPTQRLATPAAPPAVERLSPEPPPEPPWWDNPWPAILIGILALVVGGVVGYALGDKGEATTEAQRGQPAIQTVTHTTTVVKPKVVVRTNTVTANTVTQTPAPANAQNEERRIEAETNLRRVERENEELKRQLEER